MPVRLLRLLVIIAIGFSLGGRLRAQDTWNVTTSGTTQNLWGATWGDGQFVVVGEGGTILTSPDGTTWTARASGTTDWLVGVGYSADLKQYVVVGDHGDILVSTDAVTWTPQPSETTQRLNGVAYGGGVWMAVGQAGTIVTSVDGKSWKPIAVPTVLTNGWLRGITYVPGHFVLGTVAVPSNLLFPDATAITVTPDGTFDGVPTAFTYGLEAAAADGREIVTTNGAVSIGPETYPLKLAGRYGINPFPVTFADIRGVTWLNGEWIAAGTGGVILHGPEDLGGYTTIYPPAGSVDLNTAAASADVAIVAGASGTIKRAVAVPHAPRASLLTPTTYGVTRGAAVTMSGGASGSQPITYQWNRDGRPLPGATARTLVLDNVQATDSGEYTLTATNAVGVDTTTPVTLTVVTPLTLPVPIDSSFNPPLAAAPTAFRVLPNGKILVAAQIQRGSTNSYALVRLNQDGSLDDSFQPYSDAAVSRIDVTDDGKLMLLTYPFSTSGPSTRVRLNSDGSVDPTFSSTAPIAKTELVLGDGRILQMALAENVLTLSRLAVNGAVDSTYPAISVTIAPKVVMPLDPSYSVILTSRIGTDGYLVAVSAYQMIGTGTFGANSTYMFEVRSDGTIDPTFTPRTYPMFIGQIATTNGFIYYHASLSSGPLGGYRTETIGRFTSAGDLDPTYPTLSWSASYASPNVTLEPDGSVLVLNSGEYLRYDAQGSLDPNFSLRPPSSLPYGFPSLAYTSSGQWYSLANLPIGSGSSTTYLVRVTPDTNALATRLTNASGRQLTGSGASTLTLGFVAKGSRAKTMLIRGIGPSLAQFHVSNPLADPQLALIGVGNTIIGSNDDWYSATDPQRVADIAASVGAFPLAPEAKDAALLLTIPPGNYTAQITGGGAGIALAEAYDTDPAPATTADTRVVNVSARGTCSTGENALIAGFAITGSGVKQLLIRGIGPGLAQFGVTGVVQDPVLTVYKDTTAIAWNNDSSSDNTTTAAAKSVGAFQASNTDAAVVVTLPAGSYTAQVSSADGSTGVALVEVYELP